MVADVYVHRDTADFSSASTTWFDILLQGDLYRMPETVCREKKELRLIQSLLFINGDGDIDKDFCLNCTIYYTYIQMYTNKSQPKEI